MSGRKTKPATRTGSTPTSIAMHVATLGGLGGVPIAPGTVGSLAAAVCCWPLLRLGWPVHLAATAVLAVVAIVASNRAAAECDQPDPPRVIIDEFVGMWVAALALPVQAYDVCAVLLLFRLFDVVKPAPLPRLERWRGGLGIVGDDIAAGLLARATWWLLKVNFDFL
jgi:phosphatidylglycerophosphatase A